MNVKIRECIDGGHLHSTIGLSRQIEYKDFSREDFIDVINFSYECFLHLEQELDDLKASKK